MSRYNQERINDISQIYKIAPFDETETKEHKTIATTSLVCTISYMVGFDLDRLELHFGEHNKELIGKLKENKNLTIIRCLCRIRTKLMMRFKKIDEDLLFGLSGLENNQHIDANDIRQLRKYGIEVVKPNTRADKYVSIINELILKNIDNCADDFPDWIEWAFIRNLFVVPRHKDEHTLRSELAKYKSNLNLYPFQMYIYWKNPEPKGNMLLSDQRFLSILYEQNGENFAEVNRSNYRDAVGDTKQNIYSFIRNASKVCAIVDCENCDPFKLYGCLKNLDEEQLAKIDKIILCDDANTSDAWDWFNKHLSNFKIEHKEIERVMNGKSLVDIVMTASICQSHYRDNVDAFLLCSSDSDFWGVISTVDTADFLVLYEYSKCSKSIKDALTLRSIYHCAIDDFYTGNAEQIKNSVLHASVERMIKTEDLNGKNGYDLAKKVYAQNYIDASEQEINKFCEKYIRSIRLKCDADGNFSYEMTK